MAEQLKVKCKTCGVEFRSMVQADRASFENPTVQMDGNSFPCPSGHQHSYDKADHFFG